MKKIILSVIAIVGFLGLEASADRFEYVNNAKLYKDNIRNANIAGQLSILSSLLSKQLIQNKNFSEVRKTPLAVLSIVNMNNFDETNAVTDRISNNLINEMQVNGFKVIDFKVMNQIKIDSKGDYIFSRSVKDLKKHKDIVYALSGTYAEYSDGMTVSCRIIEVKTGVVMSTSQVFVPKRIIRKVTKKKQINWLKEVRPAVTESMVEITQK